MRQQSDLQERSVQVERMADVYSWADRVVVWLGPGSKSGVLAFETIKHLSSRISVTWRLISITASNQKDTLWRDISSLPLWEKEILDAMEELFNNTSFERLWVWQEIRLASESSIVVLGDNQIAWCDFRDAILGFEWKKVHRLYPGNPTIENRLETIGGMANKFDYMSFNIVLSASRNSKCTDPRDRIYAILSLAKNYTTGYEPRPSLKPDYTNQASDLYKGITVQNLKQLKTLKLLTHCELNEKGVDLPSWVPDWSMKRETSKLGLVKAWGDSLPETWIQREGILEVPGLCSAVIKDIGGELKPPYSASELNRLLRRVLPQNADSTAYATGNGSVLDAYLRALWWDGYADHYIPPFAHHLNFSSLKAEIRSFVAKEDHASTVLTPQLENIMQKLRHQVTGRRLVITADGYC
jgi:hypothetical protein